MSEPMRVKKKMAQAKTQTHSTTFTSFMKDMQKPLLIITLLQGEELHNCEAMQGRIESFCQPQTGL